MRDINHKKYLKKWKNPVSTMLFYLVYISSFVTFLGIFCIVGYIVTKGVPHLKGDLFALHYTSENVSLVPALVNTIFMTTLALCLVVPIGIGSSIYLTEYSRRDNFFVSVIRIATETLAGIPSIIYGLFGALFFVKFANLGLSLITGALTLSIMILPLIMRTTEEGLLSVPDDYREGSFALGAGKLRTIFHVVLPSAIKGILSGVILSIGRIVGESAALIFTAGTVAKIADNLFSSSRTLAVHMYTISGEGLYLNQTYATAVVLLLLVIVLNFVSGWIARQFGSEVNDE